MKKIFDHDAIKINIHDLQIIVLNGFVDLVIYRSEFCFNEYCIMGSYIEFYANSGQTWVNYIFLLYLCHRGCI